MTFHDFNLGQLKKYKFLRKDLWIGHVKKQNAKHKRWTHTNNNLVLWLEPKSVLTWFCWTCVLRRLIDTDEAWLGRGNNTMCTWARYLLSHVGVHIYLASCYAMKSVRTIDLNWSTAEKDCTYIASSEAWSTNSTDCFLVNKSSLLSSPLRPRPNPNSYLAGIFWEDRTVIFTV